ncbi:hypothetical protein T8T21_00775 [Limimaricola variabilis]|uniref:VpaChn25_0724 family phage protein n=1 Tax=Limimaricola variabilis TaxID=1492771 RepID=UPI002AC8AB82|nr:hypothetical protein [Limimaricola variabilis]WPY94692.1 hypothetical protein T8T21_00775 [Limimaricola variabilis]
MDHLKLTTEHRRLTILRHLAASPGYTSNGSILHDVCNGLGVSSTWDQMVGTLAWLKEQELVALEAHEQLTIVSATARGVEVANGQASHPGVKRPSARL